MSEAVLSAKYMDHYFYFAKRADADEAARRLRGRGQIRRIGLCWPRQPGPIQELVHLHAELDQLAKDVNGEYGGWEIPAAPKEQSK
jgi:hypothetical protein